jgi:coenzyme F420 biosynthesis associated uncharacterized protein
MEARAAVAAAAGYALMMDAIDWRLAQRVGERIAGAPPRGGVRAADVQPLVHDFAHRVAAYSCLPEPEELPPLQTVDRAEWIAANLRSMRPLLAPLSERLGDGAGPLSGPLRSASGFLLGAQVGALTGVLSQRVLGQYDLALLDSSAPPRLLLLAPNLAISARNMGVEREDLVLWVSIHEITHAVQFAAAPWLREHLGGMLRELIDGLQVTLAGRFGPEHEHDAGATPARGWLPGLPDPGELRELLERARRGELLRMTLGEDRWRLVERIQAAMSLIEGHAEHTMDAVGAEVLPTMPRLRAAMTRRRQSRPLPWRVLERVLGLELKLRQYETGRRFCDAIVAEEGPYALAWAWSGPQSLPTLTELDAPAEWLARVGEERAAGRTDVPHGRTDVPPVTK